MLHRIAPIQTARAAKNYVQYRKQFAYICRFQKKKTSGLVADSRIDRPGTNGEVELKPQLVIHPCIAHCPEKGGEKA
jgi:hypothetical protein